MECAECLDTNCVIDIDEFVNGEDVVVRLRYDFDNLERNEFDIQIVRYGKGNESDRSDWSYSYNTNYCPFCGRKLDYQMTKDVVDGYLINYDTNLIFDDEVTTIWLRLDKENKLLELGVKYKDEVYTNHIEVKYDPVTGELL